MAAQLLPPKPCPVCQVAMVSEPVDPLFGYDVLVCKSCSTKVLIHHRASDDEDED
jgi:DNA-directed RNA polymerase subunit RPC12/RpoP